MELRLTLPPPILGGNHERGEHGVMRWSKRLGRMVPGVKKYVRTEAAEYRRRVATIAFVEMRAQRWTPPDAAKMDVIYFNIRLDRDNLHKAVGDAVAKSGVLDCSDYWILDGRIAHFWDDGPARVEVTIAPANRKAYDFRGRKPAVGAASA